MKTIVLDITKQISQGTLHNGTLSFTMFIDNLKDKIKQEMGSPRQILELALAKLLEDPAFNGPVYIGDVKKFEDQFRLIYSMLVPSIQVEKHFIWGLGEPLWPKLFFGTDALYNLLMDSETKQLRVNLIENQSNDVSQNIINVYLFILEKLYGFPKFEQSDLIVCLGEQKTALKKYYRINIDSRFADVFAKAKLPLIDCNYIKRKLNEGISVDWMLDIFSLDAFSFNGFSVFTVTDVTQEFTLEELKNIILNRTELDSEVYFSRLTETLKMLAGDPAIDFGMMPLLKVNNKLIFNYNTLVYSKFITGISKSEINEKTYLHLASSFLEHPKKIIIQDLSTSNIESDWVNVLQHEGIKSFALLPVYHNDHLCGIFEVYSDHMNGINEDVLFKLNPALDLIGRVYENAIREFQNEIENVIRDKFTSLQQSVTWKFNNAAWHYLRDKAIKLPDVVMELIEFKDVYPLYGAIDIRNSTIERNTALRQDLDALFTILIETLSTLKRHLGLDIVDELILKTKQLHTLVNDETQTNEFLVKEFVDAQVHPVLEQLTRNGAAPVKKRVLLTVKRYFEFTAQQTGAAFTHRRSLEISIQGINSTVNHHLDLLKNQILQPYPVYFEKFRTDGVEYDIYWGQSINPAKPFNESHLKNVQLAQLKCMAEIACLTNSLLARMEKKLQTTQIIFINSGTIDISFRDDEQRFDVEGPDNIRFQIIKKRIDKVHIKETRERLTQPGKIALVYFQGKSIEDYLDLIYLLQAQDVFLDDLEFLELEELQGVLGLKALRIGVNLQG